MIELYFAPTPNGLKVKLFLEEAQLPYRLRLVSLSKGEQFAPSFGAIGPNNRIPAIVDLEPRDGGPRQSVFESGAILWYLAEKTQRFLPAGARDRLVVLQWLFWQMAGLGPMAGQNGHFRVHAPEPIPYAIERYTRETNRLYAVLNRRLAQQPFIAGEYSIADMACYPWVVPHAGHGQDLGEFPHLRRWFETIRARPATVRTYLGVEDVYARPQQALSAAAREVLFGSTAAR
jgi:GSH-dependent disulfide-bond oxidoreductase